VSRASRRHARRQERRGNQTRERTHTVDTERDERPVPQLTVTITYPPGSTTLAQEGATVTLPFVLERDEHGKAKFDLRLKTNDEDLSAEEAAALMGASLDYLRLTWSQYGDVLDVIADIERDGIQRVVPTDENTTINARGGAA
jgi:hypothetical protein